MGAIAISATSEKDRLPGVVEVAFNVKVDGKPLTFIVTLDKEARAEVESIAEDSVVVVDDNNTVRIDGETVNGDVTDLFDPQVDRLPTVIFDFTDPDAEEVDEDELKEILEEDVCSQFFFEA